MTSTPPAASLRFRERVRSRTGAVDLLVFRVGSERFAVELRAVDEVVEGPAVRAVPEVSPALLGVFPQGDGLLSLVNPSSVLGSTLLQPMHALVMRAGTRRIGVAVDDTDDVFLCELAALRAPPDDMGDDLLVGVLVEDGSLIGVLDARAFTMACVAGPIPSDL